MLDVAGVIEKSFYPRARRRYAIPKASLEEGLRAGKRLVANVSRTSIDEALAK